MALHHLHMIPLWLSFAAATVAIGLVGSLPSVGDGLEPWTPFLFAPEGPLGGVTPAAVFHGVAAGWLFVLLYRSTFHGRPFPAVRGRQWRYQARHYASYGQPGPLSYVTGLDEVDSLGIAATALAPVLVDKWASATRGSAEGAAPAPLAVLLVGATVQIAAVVAYNHKYAVDWGYLPYRGGALRRKLAALVPRRVAHSAAARHAQRQLSAASWVLQWAVAGGRGVLLGALVGVWAQRLEGGAGGALRALRGWWGAAEGGALGAAVKRAAAAAAAALGATAGAAAGPLGRAARAGDAVLGWVVEGGWQRASMALAAVVVAGALVDSTLLGPAEAADVDEDFEVVNNNLREVRHARPLLLRGLRGPGGVGRRRPV